MAWACRITAMVIIARAITMADIIPTAMAGAGGIATGGTTAGAAVTVAGVIADGEAIAAGAIVIAASRASFLKITS